MCLCLWFYLNVCVCVFFFCLFCKTLHANEKLKSPSVIRISSEQNISNEHSNEIPFEHMKKICSNQRALYVL